MNSQCQPPELTDRVSSISDPAVVSIRPYLSVSRCIQKPLFSFPPRINVLIQLLVLWKYPLPAQPVGLFIYPWIAFWEA